MHHDRRHARSAFRTASAFALTGLFALTACDSDPVGVNGDDPPDNGHEDAGRVEIQTRGAASATIAVWSDGDGWTDGEGNAITEIEAPVDVEGEGLQPLRAGGQNASLSVVFFNPDGSEVEMSTLSRDDVTRERECTEYEARYYPTTDDVTAIAWPNVRHPESTNGPFHFAHQHDGNLVGIFHCDHIHFYPEAPGEVELEFHLWHIDHSDDHTDPITIRVHEADEAARIELQTRGEAGATLGVWTEGEGWADADGNPITRIEAPRDVEGEGLQPLEAGGSNASLTVEYFAHGGREADQGTISRDDDTRERVCTHVSARYTVEANEGVLAWPNMAHPDNPEGDAQFVEREDGTVVGIFHCDHIHLYPESAGEVDVRFLIHGGEQPINQADPITFVVNE